MTRFIFLTDTHFGAHPMGYQQQPAYPERLPELVSALNAWIAAQGNVDFVLHGGDLLDRCHPDLIHEARSVLQFTVPLYVCLGNHDLTRPDAAAIWMDLAPAWFGSGPHFEIERPDVVVHVAPNHWEDRDYLWEDCQDPALRPAQIGRIKQYIAAHSDRAHVLCTHSPLFPIPSEQTGWDAPAHDPGATFRGQVTSLLDQHASLGCVLSGHSHVNTLVHRQAAMAVTCSAFVEAPFEFKVIVVDGAELSVQTLYLIDETGFAARYEYGRAFVQGRPCDRAAETSVRL